jgi:hypothetical protein
MPTPKDADHAKHDDVLSGFVRPIRLEKRRHAIEWRVKVIRNSAANNSSGQ